MDSVGTKVWFVCTCGQKTKIPGESIGKMYMCVRCGEKIRLTETNTHAIDGAGPPPPSDKTPNNTDASAAQAAPPEPAPAHRHEEAMGQQLIKAGLVKQEHVDLALAVQRDCGGKTFEILIDLGFLKEDQIHNFLGTKAGHAGIDISNYEVPKDVLALIPPEFAIQHVLLPIDKLGKLLTIGMACPIDQISVEYIQRLTGLKVKPVLCRLSDIQKALRLYFPNASRPRFDGETYEPRRPEELAHLEFGTGRLIRMLSELNTFPVHARTAQRLAQNGVQSTLREIVDVLRTDPVIAVRLMALANTPAYNMVQRVDNVGTAGALLGLDTCVRTAADSESVDYFQKPGLFDYREWWDRALYCAAASEAVAQTTGKGHATTAYSIGLLVDIGRLAMVECLPQSYATVCEGLDGFDLVKREAEVYSLPHTECGYLLAKKWGLPPIVLDAIRFHHSPRMSSEFTESTYVAAVAAALTDVQFRGAASSDEAFKEHHDLFQKLGLKRSDAEKLANDVKAPAV